MSDKRVCDRCRLPGNLLDLDTGSVCHAEPSECIRRLRQQLGDLIAVIDRDGGHTGSTPEEAAEKVVQLFAEVERLKQSILSFGSGNDFDWNVLQRLEEQEQELKCLKAEAKWNRERNGEIMAIKFNMQLRGAEIEVTAGDYEPQTLHAVFADTGEEFDFEDEEEQEAFNIACDIYQSPDT